MSEPRLHSELGASIAARWMACPGSVALSRGQPNPETEHSRRGTVAHGIGEQCLRKRKLDPDQWLDTTVDGIRVDEDMVAAVRVYVDYCRGLMQETDARWWVEQSFDLGTLNPPAPMFGTCDFAIYKPKLRELEIVDYKNGSGVIVDARGNKQLRYYALGVALSLAGEIDAETVRMTIVQPNAPHTDGSVRSDTMAYSDLLAFSADLMDAANATVDPAAPLVTGSHCRFCPAAAICPAQHEHAQALAQVAFADMPLDVPPEPAALPPAVLGDVLSKLHILEDWAANVRAYAKHELEQGRPVPGMKLVAGRKGNRRWVDEAATETALQALGLEPEEYQKTTLKSPAQVEKLLTKPQRGGLADLYEQPDGKPMMVRDTDPRPALALHAGDAFLALPPSTE